MAIPNPTELPARPVAGAPLSADTGAAPLVEPQDIRRVRLYCRLAAALPALAAVLLAVIAAWISTVLLDWRWSSPRIVVPLALVAVIATARYLQAELRLRTYRLSLTPDAVIFTLGRRRTYVPRRHVQLFDTESGFLLRRFGLRRCNLHTAGGTIVISPAPVRAAAAIERLIQEQGLPAPAGQTHGTA